jgi:DNA-binding MarR family transcriptional regulator
VEESRHTFNIPLGRHLHIASRVYFSALSSRLKGAGLDRYYAVLICVDQEGGYISQQLVGRKLMIDKASMVKIVDHLDEYGFLERITNPNDRRSYHLCLTEKAKAVLPLIYEAMERLDTEVFAGFSRDQVGLFREMLCKVRGVLMRIDSEKL